MTRTAGLVGAAVALMAGPAPAQPPAKTASAPGPRQTTRAVPLDFQGWFEATPRELKATPKLLSMNGRHVRLVGYMAHMEAAPKGVFFLCPHPTFCDEEGAGTADLPPEAVRVTVRGARGQQLPFSARPLIVTGVLQIGPRAEADGQVSSLRLILDQAVQPAHKRR